MFGLTEKCLRRHCPGHAGVNGNDRVDRPAGKAAIRGGLRLGIFQMLRSLRHHLQVQSHGHHSCTIDRLEKRGSKDENYGNRESDEDSVWLSMWRGDTNDFTRNLLTLWCAFVKMQLHQPGDPQCVRLRNDISTFRFPSVPPPPPTDFSSNIKQRTMPTVSSKGDS